MRSVGPRHVAAGWQALVCACLVWLVADMVTPANLLKVCVACVRLQERGMHYALCCASLVTFPLCRLGNPAVYPPCAAICTHFFPLPGQEPGKEGGAADGGGISPRLPHAAPWPPPPRRNAGLVARLVVPLRCLGPRAAAAPV